MSKKYRVERKTLKNITLKSEVKPEKIPDVLIKPRYKNWREFLDRYPDVMENLWDLLLPQSFICEKSEKYKHKINGRYKYDYLFGYNDYCFEIPNYEDIFYYFYYSEIETIFHIEKWWKQYRIGFPTNLSLLSYSDFEWGYFVEYPPAPTKTLDQISSNPWLN